MNSTNAIVFVHEDHLSDENPALLAFPNAPAVFIFDEPHLRREPLAFHRLFFLYESVCEVFAARQAITSIRRGDVVNEISGFARTNGATRIITTETPEPRLRGYFAALRGQGLMVEVLPVPQLVPYDAMRTPSRFSAWWREVEPLALAEGA